MHIERPHLFSLVGKGVAEEQLFLADVLHANLLNNVPIPAALSYPCGKLSVICRRVCRVFPYNYPAACARGAHTQVLYHPRGTVDL